MNKYIDPVIYKHWCHAKKKDLERAEKLLNKEIEQGILSDIKYKKELEFIRYRLFN
jgi:hypothetical protein